MIHAITSKDRPQFPCWLYHPGHPEIGGWHYWQQTNRAGFTHWSPGRCHQHPSHYPDGSTVPKWILRNACVPLR